MHSIGRSGPSWIWNQPQLENRVSWRIMSECDSVIIYFISGRIAVQCARHTHAILRPMAVVPQMSLENGTCSSRRWLLSISAGLQLLSHRGKVLEKRSKKDSYHTECHVGCTSMPHAAGTGIICTSASTTLCRFKNQQKDSWNIDWTYVVQCIYLIAFWWQFQIYSIGPKIHQPHRFILWKGSWGKAT